MNDETPAKGAPRIIFWTLFTICIIASAEGWREKCNTTICDIVGEIYNHVANTTANPCSDFYTFACSGWSRKLVQWTLNSTRNTSADRIYNGKTGTWDALDRATEIILSNRMNRILSRYPNRSLNEFRSSEIQPTMFYKSCLRARKGINWALGAVTLRRFFHEVDLFFFDEPVTPERTAFSALLKLAMQFEINPLFRVTLKDKQYIVRKSELLSSLPPNPKPVHEIVSRWKRRLRSFANSSQFDARIHTRYAATLEAFQIHVDEKTLVRMGRNFLAVEIAIRREFIQSDSHYENIPFYTYSAELNSTYFDLFYPHMGTSGILQRKDILNMQPKFFVPLALLTRDASFSELFNDYLRMYLLRSEFFELVGRTKCAFFPCDFSIQRDPARDCVILVSSHTDQR